MVICEFTEIFDEIGEKTDDRLPLETVLK